jgi:hypothetical protein
MTQQVEAAAANEERSAQPANPEVG